ncbi:hypothetical protein Tco_0714698, partial [Tanacetum coccineum]
VPAVVGGGGDDVDCGGGCGGVAVGLMVCSGGD